MRTMEEMKEIAIANLKKLNVQPSAIEAFEKDVSNVWCSEHIKLGTTRVGALYEINQAGGYTYEEECSKAIKKVKEDGGLPYHVVQTRFTSGNTFAVLYASPYEEDEGLITDDCAIVLREYEVCSYVYNADVEDMSEYGYITVKGSCGGIIRTA